VDTEILHLTNMLGAVDYATYADPTLLLRPRDDRLDGLKAPEDIIVLKWTSRLMHEQIQFNAKIPLTNVKPPAEIEVELSRVQNFTGDMKGLYVLTSVLKVIYRRQHFNCDEAIAFTLGEWTVAVIAERLRSYNCPDYLVGHIEYATEGIVHGDIMYCILSFLFCECPESLRPHHCPWQEAIASLDDAKAAWDTIRHGWVELQTPFDMTTLAGFTPDTTNVQAIVAAKDALQNAVQMVQYACAARATNLQIYTCIWKRIHSKALDVLLVRVHSDLPFQMINRREAREKAAYTTVDTIKLSKILQIDITNESPKIEAILSDHYENLQRIFEYYAASEVGDAGSMSLDEFYHFLKDCKLISKSLSLAYVKKIFSSINQGEDEDDSDPFNPDMEFTANEFIQALICVAERRFNTKSSSLCQRVKRCLTDFVLTNACRASMDLFHSEMNAPACKAVFQNNQSTLEIIYRRYAGKSSLNVDGFMIFLQDYEFIPDSLTNSDVQNIFTKIQQNDDETEGFTTGEGTHDSALELTFTEFTEAVGAVALYDNPNMFVPIPERLEQFLALLNAKSASILNN
ncbi:hypothetical protein THRCLA_10466, partial [Thraustotheca clavata]